MKHEMITKGEIKLIGLTARTNNHDEFNHPEKAKIGPLVGAYWGNQVANAFKHRVNPGVTYAVYTDFVSDRHEDYTYFIGEEVESFDDQDLSKFETLIIPAAKYQKFTSDPGEMPSVVIESWQTIWAMEDENQLDGKRAYVADFEVYDQRASDPNAAVIDIFIGLR